MKLHKTKEKELYYYFLKSGSKRFMYRHKYDDALGKRKEKKKSGFKTEKEALRSLLEVKAAILNGGHIQVEKSNMTISQWMDIWFDSKQRNWKVSTRSMRKGVIDKYIKPLIGQRILSSMTKSDYERGFINKLLDDGLEPSTVKSYHDIFSIAINAAVDEDIITKNRFTKTKLNQDEVLDNFLSPTDLDTFLYYAEKYTSKTGNMMIQLLAFSGIRKGEAQGLKWKNVDFQNNTITIDCTRDEKGDRTPKTKNSYRTIEIDEIVMKELKQYKKWCMEKLLSYGNKLDNNSYVFISMYGVPVSGGYLNMLFPRLYLKLRENNVQLKQITPHGLRHTHATILVDQLIPPPDVASRLGNTLEMVYRVYSHAFEKADNKTVSAFRNSLFGAKAGAK